MFDSSMITKLPVYTHQIGSGSKLSVKKIVIMILFPVSIPYFMYHAILAFRKRFGLIPRPLEGKVVVITGANSGIGKSLASLLYINGCKLILTAQRIQDLDHVRAEIVQNRTYGVVYVPAALQLDLSDFSDVNSKGEEILSIYGKVDILINNAEIGHRGNVLETELAVDQQIMAMNYFGPLALTKLLAPSMVEKKGGRVVFISSVQGKIAIPFSCFERSAYTASKHALQALADSLRAELTDLGVQVTVVSPGYVNTQLSSALTGSGENCEWVDAHSASGYTPEYIAEKTLEAMSKGENEVIVSSWLPRIAIYLRTLWPNCFFWLMAKQVCKG